MYFLFIKTIYKGRAIMRKIIIAFSFILVFSFELIIFLIIAIKLENLFIKYNQKAKVAFSYENERQKIIKTGLE